MPPRFHTQPHIRQMASRAANTLLRLGSLVTKMVFTLYMGRYMGLSELGRYGLVAAYVAVLVTVLGVRFDYVVSRDIVDASPFDIARKIRDQVVFYGLNYLLLALVMLVGILGPLKGFGREVLAFTLVISVLESVAAITSGNVVSLKKPILANVLFFIRASAWTIPAMLTGILAPSLRTADMIFLCWTLGVLASLLATVIAWRNLPWAQVFSTPVDWAWVKKGVGRCAFIWLGAMGAAAATYVDRFTVEHYLTLDYVGIASFYGSFVLAIQSLMHSSVFAFSYPRLISHYRKREDRLFRQEVWRMTLQAMGFAGVMALGVGLAVPGLGKLFHRAEFAQYSTTLWLILLGVWLKASTESVYYVLYARHQDRLISIGGLLFLIPAFAFNILLVPRLGFIGIGYSAVIAAALLCVWRIYCLNFFKPAAYEQPETTAKALASDAKDEIF